MGVLYKYFDNLILLLLIISPVYPVFFVISWKTDRKNKAFYTLVYFYVVKER